MGNSWNWKQTLAFFLLFLPAMVFYALQKRAGQYASGSFIQTPAHWLQSGYDLVANHVQESLNTYFYLVDTNRLNKELKTQNAKLASKVLLLEEYRSENVRLRELFKFRQEFPRKTLAARVISKDIIDERKSLVIDKGARHGIQRLQGVIAENGVVGYTIEVEEESSRILLLSNKNASVDALVQRTRARGIVSGDTRQSYRLKHMMRHEDAQAGDVIITSGRKGFFPKGFHIGQVVNIDNSLTGVSYVAHIKPAVEIDKLEQVLVIVEDLEETETKK